MKVGPHVMTHSHSNQHHHEREIVPRVGSAQTGGNLKLIQCQLMLLLHARRCQQRHELMIARNNSNSNNNSNSHQHQPNVTNTVARAILLNCPIRHCLAMKEVLNHMKTCRLGGTCTYQHCTTSLRILSHWTNCTIEDCPLCQCVRQRMRRAKEWESTLPRSSRYTLLAAALRSSQVPRPVPPNCNAAEQAQEGQSGVPCQNQEDLRWNNSDNPQQQPQQQQQQNNGSMLVPVQQHPKQSNPCDKLSGDKAVEKHSAPSLDQVRRAYEQLGIPCPAEALQRLMATLPPSQLQDGANQFEADNRMDTNDNNGDQGVFDCSSMEPSPSSSDSERSANQQNPAISSTTTSTIPLRLPFKSSTYSRPK